MFPVVKDPGFVDPAWEHVVAAFGFAAGLWPKAFEPNSRGVHIAWAPALAKYSYDELCTAFGVLAKRGDFPRQHQLIAWLRDEYPKDIAPRLMAPVATIEDRWRTEAIAFWAGKPDGAAGLADRLAEIAVSEYGPCIRAHRKQSAADVAVILCDRREAGEKIDPTKLDGDLRIAARAEWLRRHPVAS